MINFFRKTRKKMADDNKPIKYMRYAIGEIVLVVIGILIALSINNWNEERKIKINSKEYIKRLIKDIVSDTTNIHNGMKVRNKTIINIKAYFEYFDTNKASLEVYLDSTVAVNTQLLRYIPVNYTFEDMQSSGNLNLLSSNQQQSLFKLSSAQKFAQLTAEKVMNEYFHEAKEKNKFLGRRNGSNFKNYHDVVGMKQDRQRLAQGLLHKQNMLSVLKLYHTLQLNIGNEIIQKSKETINILNSDI